MPMHDPPAPPSVAPAQGPGVKHEASDVNVRGVLAFGFAMIVAGIILHLLLTLLFRDLRVREREASPPPAPLISRGRLTLPHDVPGEKLLAGPAFDSPLERKEPPTLTPALVPKQQIAPAPDWDKMRKEQEAQLNHPPQGGRSIEETMRLLTEPGQGALAKKYLPVRPEARKREMLEFGEIIPSEASSGRTLQSGRR